MLAWQVFVFASPCLSQIQASDQMQQITSAGQQITYMSALMHAVNELHDVDALSIIYCIVQNSASFIDTLRLRDSDSSSFQCFQQS